MTDQENKKLKAAIAEYCDVAEKKYEKKWPNANWPYLHNCRLYDIKVIQALTALMRQAIERGSPVTEDESNEAQGLTRKSWCV